MTKGQKFCAHMRGLAEGCGEYLTRRFLSVSSRECARFFFTCWECSTVWSPRPTLKNCNARYSTALELPSGPIFLARISLGRGAQRHGPATWRRQLLIILWQGVGGPCFRVAVVLHLHDQGISFKIIIVRGEPFRLTRCFF